MRGRKFFYFKLKSGFVEGMFSGMSERSYAILDPLPVEGYVDVIFHLSEDLVATKKENDDSYNLAFSIGCRKYKTSTKW